MRLTLTFLALALAASTSTISASQSVFQADAPVDSSPYAFPLSQDPRRRAKDIYKIEDIERVTRKEDHGGSGKVSPFLHAHRKQFSALGNDNAQALYDRFHHLAYNSTDRPTSFTVTSDRHFNLLSYAVEPEHRDHIRIRLIQHDDEESIAGRVEFMPPFKRREGEGGVGTTLDFAGWQVWWRGIEFDVWQSRYFDPNFYSYFTQSHIIGRSPQDAFPLEVPESVLKKASSSSSSAGAVTTSAEAANLMILEVAAWSSDVREAVLVFDGGYWDVDHALWESVQKADWEDVILPDSLKSAIRHEYRSFFSSERIYKDLGVAWKRGVIFLGPPGNGKTISIKAMMRDVLNGEGGVGRETKRVLYVKSFQTWAGDEAGIKQIFGRARQEAPCLVVFEDIDSLITDSNRAFFLNEVDGLEDNDGLLMVATTNHFDRLDPALSNRPSRFDRKYSFPDPVKAERRQYAVYWQDKLADNKRIKFPDRLLDDFAAKTDGFSFAYMKEAFVSALLVLAGDESQSRSFPRELMEQVAKLRKELDNDKKYEL